MAIVDAANRTTMGLLAEEAVAGIGGEVGLLDMNAALESMPGIPSRPDQTQARAVTTGTDPNLVATMVAPVSRNPGKTQQLSNKQRGDLDEKSPRRKLSSEDVLEDDLRTPEKWWGGDLNPRPAGYESAALTN